MERCPVCRAALGGALECRRCHADLHKLSEVAAEARALAGHAMLMFSRGDAGAALRLLQRARVLQDAPELRRLALILRFDGLSPASVPQSSDPLPPGREEEPPQPEEDVSDRRTNL